MSTPERRDVAGPLRILLGEDDPGRTGAIREAFRDSKSNAEIETVGSLGEFRVLAAARPPDIAILDADLSGGEALTVLRAPPEAGPFPILVVSGPGGEGRAEAVLRAGAIDFIVLSPCILAALPFLVPRVLREWRLRLAHKRNLEALAASEASLQAILQSTADGVLAVDRDGRVLYYNERFVEMWQIPPDVITTQSDAALLGSIRDQLTDPDGFLAKVAALSASTEEDFDTIHFKDGRVFDRVSRPLLVGTNHRGRVWSFSDVGDQIRTEEALRESEGIFRQLMKNSPVYIFFKDEKDRVLRLSDNFEKMLGLPLDDMLGKGMEDFYPAETAGKMIEDDFQVLRTGSRIESDEEIGGRHYTTIKFPILIEGKRSLAGFTIDITDRTLMEKNLRASLREKDVLLQEIHHRVKNNMQVISSLFSIQSRHTQNAECREILREGQARIRSMSLVHERLYQSSDLSRIDLPEYIQSLIVHLFQVHLVDAEQVRLETDLEPISLEINTAVPFGLIINELISNAIKHAFPDGRKGLIKIRLRRGAGGEVILRVADDGVGFQGGLDFRKAESFGLKIVNLLVSQVRGVIDLDRSGGTAFIITFREPSAEAK
ncbi:MAG: PAS domain-containing protein [Candidatus Aminicenantes bacterium]|nr:PAS domain-containing protein [Candidatus Aminicenantes bacterium]